MQVFISGLELSNHETSLTYFHMLTEYLTSLSGSRGEQLHLSSRTRVMFIGNSFGIRKPVDYTDVESFCCSRAWIADTLDTFFVELAVRVLKYCMNGFCI